MHFILKDVRHIVGLAVDPSPWVKSGRIKASDAVDRHWAYWETVVQVSVQLNYILGMMFIR